MSQGWDKAEYRCGTCGGGFTAETEQEYVNRHSAHLSAHALVAMLSPAALAELRAILATPDEDEPEEGCGADECLWRDDPAPSHEPREHQVNAP